MPKNNPNREGESKQTAQIINAGAQPAAPQLWPNVSVLGSLASGTYFLTNAMDVNVRLARRPVDDTLKPLRATRPYAARSLTSSLHHLPGVHGSRAAPHRQVS